MDWENGLLESTGASRPAWKSLFCQLVTLQSHANCVSSPMVTWIFAKAVVSITYLEIMHLTHSWHLVKSVFTVSLPDVWVTLGCPLHVSAAWSEFTASALWLPPSWSLINIIVPGTVVDTVCAFSCLIFLPQQSCKIRGAMVIRVSQMRKLGVTECGWFAQYFP